MSARAGADEAEHAEGGARDFPDAAAAHVRHVENLPVRRELDVLRDRSRRHRENAGHALALHVHLEQLARELTGRDQVAAVGREIHVVDSAARNVQRVVQSKGVREAEVEAGEPLGDDDREASVRGEVHVVRVGHRDRTAGQPVARVDRRHAVAEVVEHVERLQVVRRGHVLGEGADREVADDLERPRVDLVDAVALAVRDVDQRAVAPDDRTERAGRIGCVDVRRGECLRREGNATRTPGRHQLADRGRRASLAVPAGDQDSVAPAHSGEVREGLGQRARAAESAARWIDRGDARSRRAHDGAPAADHVGDTAKRCRRRVGGRRGQPPDRMDSSLRRVERQHRPRRGPARSRAACDQQPAAGSRHGRVAKRYGQPGRNAGWGTRSPGEDRVQPTRAGEPADEVGGSGDGRGGEV